jgi:hypothetical protein
MLLKGVHVVLDLQQNGFVGGVYVEEVVLPKVLFLAQSTSVTIS